MCQDAINPVQFRLHVLPPLLGVVVSALIWVCFTHVQLILEPENSVGSLTEDKEPLFQLSLLQFSSFMLPPPGAPFPGPSDQKDGSFLSERSVYHLASPSPPSHPQDRTARKTTGTFIPAVVSPSFGFRSQFERLYFSEASGSCFLCFDKFFILISRREILQRAHATMLNLELVICSSNDF